MYLKEMKNGLLLFLVITCFVYQLTGVLLSQYYPSNFVSNVVFYGEGLKCFACTSMVIPECQDRVEYVKYRKIDGDCKPYSNFTSQCALLIWQEIHMAAQRPTFYVKRFCSHPTRDYKFCDAYRILAMEIGFNQTTCDLCKNRYCNSAVVHYDGSGADQPSALNLANSFVSALLTSMTGSNYFT